MNLVLQRRESGNEGTFGTLLNWFTGELPWRDNARSVSCIPAGIYRCAWAWSPRFRRFTYRLQNVEGRSGVLIHSANLMGDAALGYRSQLNGCIALGEKLGWIEGQKAVLLSRTAVTGLESLLHQQEFTLEVRDA